MSATRTATWVGSMVASIVAVLASGCTSVSGATLGQACAKDNDCLAPFVCAFSTCHVSCNSAVDCQAIERCVASVSGPNPARVCQAQVASTCAGGATCSAPEVCGADEECRAPCQAQGDCPGGQYCVVVSGAAACYQADDPADQVALLNAGVIAPDGAALVNPGPDASFAVLAPAANDAGPLADGATDAGVDSGNADAGPPADGATDAGADSGNADASGDAAP